MAVDTKKYKDLFCSEADDQLAILSSSLLALEKDPQQIELYEELMRSAHTVKGAAATMGYVAIAELSHAMEDIFHSAERGAFTIDSKIISLLLSAMDDLKASLISIREHDTELPQALVIKEIKNVLIEGSHYAGAQVATEVNHDVRPAHIVAPDTIKVSIDKLDVLMGLFEEMLMIRLKVSSLMGPAVELVQSIEDSSLKHQLFFIKELQTTFVDFARLLSENQGVLLSIRLVPLELIFNQLPRMVRDLSVRENKQIEFIIEGGDIALDRTVIDGLGGALAHLLRNAVDHGIVSQGIIRLSAVRVGARARITVEDNGGGIDYERVKDVALSHGVATKEQLASMRAEQVAELLFHSNMSTTEVVTDISGRGVGLSAVRWFTEEVGGHVDVFSPVPETGVGTRFVLDLPISLATVRVLVVQVRWYTFAIPLEGIIKTLQFKEGDVRDAAHQETLFVDGEFLPLIHLVGILKLTFGASPVESSLERMRSAVIMRAGESSFAVEVDECTGEQDLLVKSLPPVLRSDKCFSGSALLPDGRTILLLDGHGLLAHALSDILRHTSS